MTLERTAAEAAVVRPHARALENVGFGLLLAFSGALQVSIAAANILLSLLMLCWLGLVISRREQVTLPSMWWPLVAYAAATLLATAFSVDPLESLVDSKQLVLFLIVPVVYRLGRGERGVTVLSTIVTVGAVSALYGIFQYGILNYDHLGRRPQGSMSHYMTYSGLLMLVACAAVARVLYRRQDRIWPALMLPALLVALTLTFTRSAWVGACAGIALLLMLRDFRLVTAFPILLAIFFGLAPAQLTNRVYSMFDLNDPTNRDRVAMIRTGVHMVGDRPLTGVGPNMVLRVYPEYREPDAVEAVNPHLHNVPLQVAAERGLPALAVWIWLVGTILKDLWPRFRTSRYPSVVATGLAAVAAMLGAGLFEYNFGDSEFLMLFLVIVTLAYAADERPPRRRDHAVA